VKKPQLSKRLKNLQEKLETIQNEILDLEKFRDTKQLQRFKRQLQGEQSHIKEQIKKLGLTSKQKTRQKLKQLKKANQNRSSKNKRSWNFVKSIQRNYFPDKSLKEIRSALKKHRQGLETDIPDVAWRNPSP